MYTWGAYNNPKVMKQFTERWPGVQAELLRLERTDDREVGSAKGTSGYDIVVPTGAFIPAMVEDELLQPLDWTVSPTSKTSKSSTGTSRGTRATALHLQGLGYDGLCYDKTKIDVAMATWQDFLDAAMDEASGNVHARGPDDVGGPLLWANDKLEHRGHGCARACEDFLIDSLPRTSRRSSPTPAAVTSRTAIRTSVQAWNGDGRQGIIDSDNRQLGVGIPVPVASSGWTTGASRRAHRTPTRRTRGSTTSSSPRCR